MKVLAVLASAGALAGVSQAQTRSHLLRVHIMTQKVALYEQCQWEDRAVRCDSGMFCVEREENFGWCLKQEPVEGEQCGGAETNGPWSVPCNGTDLSCVLISSQFSQCQKTADRQKLKKPLDQQTHHHHHHHKEAKESEAVKLWGRCKWEDGSKACGSGLQCVEESAWSGRCMKKDAETYDQCGGQEWRGRWKAACPKSATCKMTDNWYSQCLPEAAS